MVIRHRKDLHCKYASKCFRSKQECKWETSFHNKTPPECLLSEEEHIKMKAYKRHYGRKMKDDGWHTYNFRRSKPSLSRREKKKLKK